MSARTFDEITVPYGDKETRAMRIACAHCGEVAYFPFLNGASRKPPAMAAKHFENKGWIVGSGPKKDFCPAHASPAHRRTDKAPIVDAGTQRAADDVPSVADTPAEMSRDERRIIFAKLNDVYGEGGYQAPWTDAAVAKDLGIGPAWVREIRAEFFGPEGSNPQYDACIAACAAAEAAFDRLSRLHGDLFREATRAAEAAQAEIRKLIDEARAEGRAEFTAAKEAMETVRRTRAAIGEVTGK